MANSVNNSAFTNRYLTAEQLNAMSNEDINKYCFINGNRTEWETDFNDEICDNIDRYELLKTLSGRPLSYIKTKIAYNLLNWLPEGKKLNPKLLFTLQSILAKNKVEVRNASLKGTANQHISTSCTNLTEIINKAFECGTSVD